MDSKVVFSPWSELAHQEISSSYDQSAIYQDSVKNLAIQRAYLLVTEQYSNLLSHFRADEYSDADFLLSYPAARIIISIIGDARVQRRYASGEAEFFTYSNSVDDSVEPPSAREILSDYITLSECRAGDASDTIQPHSKIRNEPVPDEISKFLKGMSFDGPLKSRKSYVDEFPPAAASEGERPTYFTSVSDYVSIASQIERDKWKLESRHVSDGKVFISHSELAELCEKQIEIEVNDDLPLDIPEEVEQELIEHSQAVEAMLPDEYREYEIDSVEPGLFPPIIDELLDRVNGNENVIHEGRFTLGTFLVNIGLSTDEIVEMLGAGGEFYEEQTRYQINHIRNGGDDGEPYTPPTYQTIESWGIEWERDSLEEKVKHPLQYYTIKLRQSSDS